MLTKRALIDALEATEATDDAPVIVDGVRLSVNDLVVVAEVRDSHAGNGVFLLAKVA